MDNTLFIVGISVFALLIGGGIAYLLGKIKSLKGDISTLESDVKESKQETAVLKNRDNQPEFMVMRTPASIDRDPTPPKVIELEKELDTIIEKLDTGWSISPEDRKQQVPKEEKEVLRQRYDSIISQIVSEFLKDSDARFFNDSLSSK